MDELQSISMQVNRQNTDDLERRLRKILGKKENSLDKRKEIKNILQDVNKEA